MRLERSETGCVPCREGLGRSRSPAAPFAAIPKHAMESSMQALELLELSGFAVLLALG